MLTSNVSIMTQVLNVYVQRAKFIPTLTQKIIINIWKNVLISTNVLQEPIANPILNHKKLEFRIRVGFIGFKGNHACPDNLICHNLYCEGDDFLGIPCEYGQSYVCACPYNPYSDGFTVGDPSSDAITSGTGSSYNVAFGLEPTSGECAATGTKGWHKGSCGITNIHDVNYAVDVLVTNLQADGHPDTGFGVGACPNFDQCADDVLHRINSLTAPTSASGPSYNIKIYKFPF